MGVRRVREVVGKLVVMGGNSHTQSYIRLCAYMSARLYVSLYVNACVYPASIHSYTAHIQRRDYRRRQMGDFSNSKMTPDQVLTSL